MVQDGVPKKENKTKKTIQVTLYSHWVDPLSGGTVHHSGQGGTLT